MEATKRPTTTLKKLQEILADNGHSLILQFCRCAKDDCNGTAMSFEVVSIRWRRWPSGLAVGQRNVGLTDGRKTCKRTSVPKTPSVEPSGEQRAEKRPLLQSGTNSRKKYGPFLNGTTISCNLHMFAMRQNSKKIISSPQTMWENLPA